MISCNESPVVDDILYWCEEAYKTDSALIYNRYSLVPLKVVYVQYLKKERKKKHYPMLFYPKIVATR